VTFLSNDKRREVHCFGAQSSALRTVNDLQKNKRRWYYSAPHWHNGDVLQN